MSGASDWPQRAFWLAAVLVIVTSLHFVRFGYDFGTSDQDEIVPAVLSRLDPTLLANDWYVQSQAAEPNVRTPVVIVLTLLSQVFGVAGATFLLYLASLLLLVYSIVALVRQFSGGQLAELLAPVILLLLTPRFTLGGNDLSHALYVPSMTAWGLALLACAACLSRRAILAGVLFGLATVFQPLVGLLSAFAITAGLLVSEPRADGLGRAIAVLVTTTVLVSAPQLIPIVASQLAEAATTTRNVFFDVIVRVRAPHHFLPSAFSTTSMTRFGLLFVAGITSLTLSPATRAHRRTLTSILAVIVAGCVLYTIGVEGFESSTIAKSQFFKLTVLAKTIAGICIAISIEHTLSQKYSLGLRTRPALAVVIAVIALLVASTQIGPLKSRYAIFDRKDANWTDVYRWAAETTVRDATFLMPPSNSDMRSWGQRSIVVNFKATAFQSALMQEWHDRLISVSGNADLADRYVEPSALDESYEQLSGERLQTLRLRYDFDYVARLNPLTDGDWEEVFRSGVGESAHQTGPVYVYRSVRADGAGP